MSAWPEDGEQDAATSQDVDYTIAEIKKIEAGTNTTGVVGGCINKDSAHRADDNLYITKNLSTYYPVYSQVATKNSNMVTGTSENESANNNSEKCISQFGVQDVVGNLLETSSEKITCDYTVDQIYFGKHSGNSYANTGFGDLNKAHPLIVRDSSIRLDVFKNFCGSIINSFFYLSRSFQC